MQIITSIIAAILFIISVISIKLNPFPKFQKPLPLSTILQAVLLMITLIIGIFACVWNLLSPF